MLLAGDRCGHLRDTLIPPVEASWSGAHRLRIYVDTLRPSGDGPSGSFRAAEHVDIRLAPRARERARGLPTIRGVFAEQVPPAADPPEGSPGVGARGIPMILRDCTIDADLPVALEDGSLLVIDSDVRGFGYVAWSEIAIRRSALGTIKRSEIATMIFDPCGYAEVWLYPLGEPPFSLIRWRHVHT